MDAPSDANAQNEPKPSTENIAHTFPSASTEDSKAVADTSQSTAPEQTNTAGSASAQPVYSGAVDVSSFIAQSVATPTKTAPSQWRTRLFKSHAYLPEYLVMLLVLTSLLYALTNLLNLGIDSLIHAEKSSSSSGLASYYDIGSFELVSSLAALAVSLPAFIWLYIRTKAVEAMTPAVKTHRWRKAFLGTFIAIQLVTIIGNFSVLAYQLISRMVDTGNALTLLSGSEEADPWWQLVVASLLTTALLSFVVYTLGKEYRSREDA